MQNYQLFWSQELTSQHHNELLIDWDDFIRNFTVAVHKHSHYQLNQTQRQYIKTLIDPRQTNQIYKNAFLLFAHQYWDIPSNRNRLFKMKINLSALPRLKLMTGASPQRVFVTARFKGHSPGEKVEKYELRQDKLHLLDDKGFEVHDKEVGENGFLGIGSSENNDVQVEDCIFVNKSHLKLVSVKKEKKGKKKSIFDDKEPPPQIQTLWYIRDISKSGRLRYLLDNPWKYVIIKPGVVISLGMTDDIDLVVEKVGFSAGNINFSQIDYEQLTALLNADRINYLGQIDKSVPLKTVMDLDFRQISPVEVEQLFKEGHYYPQFKDDVVKGKKDKQIPSIIFSIRNHRTFQSKQYTASLTTFSVGRDKSCTYRIEQISMRKKEIIFQRLNNFWTVRCAQSPLTTSLSTNIPAIYLASSKNIEQNRNSNRVRLRQGYPYVLRGKNCQFSIDLHEPQAKQEEDY